VGQPLTVLVRFG